MGKFLATALLGVALFGGVADAQVYVRVGPPPPVVERRPPPPTPGHVWLRGYYRWDGAHYVWAPGHWEVPPRPRAVWVAGRWVHRPGGWIWIEGHWRG